MKLLFGKLRKGASKEEVQKAIEEAKRKWIEERAKKNGIKGFTRKLSVL